MACRPGSQPLVGDEPPRLDASMAAELRISAVNEQDYEAFIQTFGNVVENCSLCAAAVWASRPFSNFDELYYKFCGFIDDLSAIGREGILRSHPDLAGWLAKMDALTPESKMEQSRAGLNTLSMEERESLEEYNRKYREKFGFPFVICARLNKKDTILEGIQTRLGNSAEQELETGVREVKKIMLLRLKNVLDSEDSKTLTASATSNIRKSNVIRLDRTAFVCLSLGIECSFWNH